MFYYTVDILGTIAFSISGVLVALEKRLDVFGVFIIAFVTAMGGGTLRDVLLGDTPVLWLRQPIYITLVTIGVVFAILFRKRLDHVRTSLLLFDSIGIGLYTMVGVGKALNAGLSPVMCVAIGTISACFGGVLRDILCNEIPVIFNKEIYATPCIFGAICYFLLCMLPIEAAYAYAASIAIIIIIRLLAVRYKITLPNIYRTTE